jgi:hypothetical protein
MDDVQALGRMRIMRVDLPKLAPITDLAEKATHMWNQTEVGAFER